jgi:hypothetical protein
MKKHYVFKKVLKEGIIHKKYNKFNLEEVWR